jgi:hypothetical protein
VTGRSRVGQNQIYTPNDRIEGDFPAKNTVYAPYERGCGPPYVFNAQVESWKVWSPEVC